VVIDKHMMVEIFFKSLYHAIISFLNFSFETVFPSTNHRIFRIQGHNYEFFGIFLILFFSMLLINVVSFPNCFPYIIQSQCRTPFYDNQAISFVFILENWVSALWKKISEAFDYWWRCMRFLWVLVFYSEFFHSLNHY
jgi:hypothetical protein